MKKITLLLVMILVGISSNAQFVENFDGTGVTAPAPGSNVWDLPSGQWQIYNDGGGNTLWGLNPLATPAFSNPRAAYVNRENIGIGVTSRNFLVTPVIQNTGLMELRFFTRTTYAADYGTEYFILAAPATADPSDPDSFTITVANWNESTLTSVAFDEYEEKVVNLNTAQLGQQFYLAFVKKFTQTGDGISGDRWIIDDIRVLMPCLPPNGLTANAQAFGATLNWTGPATATYYVHVLPAGTVFDGSTDGAIVVNGALSTVVNSTTLPTPTPLQADTAYDYYVLANCGLSTSTWSELGEFRTSIAPPACGGLFTDTGGSTGMYSNSANYVVTICPENPGDMVIVAFTAFNTEANWDGLYIYNGDSVNAPLISSGNGNGNGNLNTPGAFWGTTSPGTIEAENPSGCLTFRFVSDGTGVRDGWIANVTCVTPPDCARPTLVQAPTVLHNEMTVTWVPTAGVTDYEVLILPCGTTPSATATGTQVTGTTHTFPNLTGSTCYVVYVRALCTGENSLWTSGLTITTPMTPPACGGMFYDIGGPNANYNNNDDYTVTICPENAGDVVTVIFTSFATENNRDGLLIYNGASTSAPQIPSANGAGFGPIAPFTGAFWGNGSPGTIIAENASGCLTFRFITDGSVTNTGWTASVICSPAPACMRPTGITTSQVGHTTMTASWTAAPGVTDYIAVAVPCNDAAPTPTTIGAVAVTGTTVDFTGLLPDTCYNVYVFSVCPDGSHSLPNNSANVNTAMAPPECGGLFTDNGGQNANYLNSSNYTVTICPENDGDLVTIQFLSFETEANWDGLLIYNGNSVNAPQISSGAGAGFGAIGAYTGAFWGTNSPGLVEANNPSGCLTFRFISDGGGVRTGWVAQITCGPPPTCMRPADVLLAEVYHNRALVQWSEVNGAQEYIVFAVPCGQPAPAHTAAGGVVVTTNSALIEGLTGSTCYTFYVYAKCEGDDWSPNSIPVNGTTSMTPPECGGFFYDNGGASANYTSNADYTVTICPENPGEMVTVNFTSFETEANWDGLLIYDGPSVASTQIASTNGAGNVGIPGSYWGTGSPGTISSSHNTGCLTFRFISDGGGTRAGWVASVMCSPQPNCYKPDNFQIINSTPYSLEIGWTQDALAGQEAATSWEVIMVPAGQPIDGITGFVVDSLPYVVGGLQESTCYDFYIRAICPGEEGGFSMWLIRRNVCTKPTNDLCEDAIELPVNPNLFCAQVTNGGLMGATGSGAISTCSAAAPNADDDVWFTFTATAESHAINVQNMTGGSGLGFEVFGGGCGAFVSIYCENNTTTAPGTITSQFIRNQFVPGQTYMIRVYSVGTNPSSAQFTICVGQIPCLEAEPFCGEQPITYQNATNVPDLGQVGCLYTSPNPAFFFLEVKNTGPLNYLMTQSTTPNGPPNLDVDYVTWGPFANNEAACEFVSNLSTTNMIAQGTCPSLHGCSYSAQPTETVCIPNAIQCEVYVIMITNYANDPGYITFTQSNLNAPAAGETNCYAVNTFNYDSVSYCQSNPDPTPTLAFGAVHGVYSSTDGLVIDPVTGTIDLSESLPGTYIVTSTLELSSTSCSNNTTVIRRRTVIIYESPEATLEYPETEYCVNDAKVMPILETNKPNGVFSAAPEGLSIHPIDGSVFPGGCQPGHYVISYTIPATQGCDEYVVTFEIDIIDGPDFPELEDVTVCGEYTVPAYEGGHFYNNEDGLGEILDGTTLTSTTTIYLIGGEGNCREVIAQQINIISGETLEAPEDVEACDSYELGAPSAGNYFDAPNGGGNNINNTTITANTTVYWFVDLGECSQEVSFAITINATPATPVVSDVEACNSYILPALAEGAYFNAAGEELAAGSGVTSTQTITVVVDNNGCTASASFTVTISTIPGIVEPESVAVCDQYVLDTPAQGHYYSQAQGLGTQLDGATLTSTTTVYWFIESGECNVEYVFTVAISATPVVPDYPNVVECDAYELPALTSGAYFDEAGNIIAAGTSITSTQTVFVREFAADNADCYAEDAILITISNLPTVAVQNGCIDNAYTIVATVTNAVPGTTYNYTWYAPNGNVVGTNSDSLVLSGTEGLGEYTVVVSAAGSDCEGTGIANVASTQCMIQKGISADGDGVNDYFDLAGYAVSKLSVYNRYGLKVYDRGNYSVEFVGKDNDGNELPVGTYYYVIELSNGQSAITGWIYIAR